MTTANRASLALTAILVLIALGTAAEPRAQDAAGGDRIHARVTTEDGNTWEGRVRFGVDEEALWGNYFNGAKDGNPWAAWVPREDLEERVPIEVFAIPLGSWRREIDLDRPFMARFGDIARIDAQGRDLRVTLKSGTVVALDRYGADDFADGVRVWVDGGRIVDLDEWRIDSIELVPAPASGGQPVPLDAGAGGPLHGTVRTRSGTYTGLVQWDREQCLLDDTLEGDSADGRVSLPFREIRSIERRSGDSVLLGLVDGREVVLSRSHEAGAGNRGIYVDDPRFGRVLVRWEAFERVDFSPGGAGPAYSDFPPGRPLTGSVTTRSGMRIAGRLVFDLDESETTETLDAPWRDVDYTIPFGLVASIVLPGTEVGAGAEAEAEAEAGAGAAGIALHSGEPLELELAGDLDARNAGMLIFTAGDDDQGPWYLPWAEIARIDFERPQAMEPAVVR